MKYPKIALYVDLIFCLIVMPLIIMLVPIDKWIKNNYLFVITLIIYLYALYFTYRKVNLPSLFIQHKFGRIILIIILLLSVTELLTHFPLPDIHNSKLSINFRKHLHAQTIWFFFLIISGFSLAIEIAFELFRQILSKQEIETAKNKAELALYKAQINPHFLFNTLNALYGLAITKSDHTESAFVKFSNILKYMYTNSSSETIDVGKEIDYIRQYVDLQLLRLNRHTQVIFESQTDEEQIQIPPMILITFVENAFKYGTSSDEDCSIIIRIIVKEGILNFETHNAIMKNIQGKSSTIGIENCRKRLELLYPGRFSLDITKDTEKNTFKTRLIIRLR
ncbi:sensor histidine kinase [Coprobacter tertius]|uniref:Histidine kinase n=1 Tax=Coprobacter tertius TaxID=2944915 RepID=A0ABT1MHB9_9BACT|nr:histidine kinase [Coprobacter tertius]MCP9612030.1 histidine kinase [Coprobacter tertius]